MEHVEGGEGFASKMKPENVKWRITHASSEDRNLRIERLISHECLFTEDGNSSPDHWTSTKNLSPSSSQWAHCLGSGWMSCSLQSLPINTAHFKPSVGLPVACCSMSSLMRFLCHSQIISISGNSSLPPFTSLFRLTRRWKVCGNELKI